MKVQSFSRYNSLPKDKLKIVFDPRVVKKDQEAVKSINAKIQQEKNYEAMKYNWFKQNRQDILNSLSKTRQKNQELENKAGVHKVRLQKNPLKPQVSPRLLELSSPKLPKTGTSEDYIDFKGLISTEFKEALSIIKKPTPERLNTNQSKKSLTTLSSERSSFPRASTSQGKAISAPEIRINPATNHL